MSNWKTDFKVNYRLEFIHFNGNKETQYSYLIVEAENEDKAVEIVTKHYENSQFLIIDGVTKIWNY